MQYVTNYLSEFWSLTLAMSPYLLIGFLFAGILKAWFPKRWIEKYLSKNDFRSVLNAAILGIPIPLCSCGVIPTGISLHKNGASKGASISFLISTPQTGIDSILVTYSMLGLPFAIIRVIAALTTGLFGGWLTNIYGKDNQPKNELHLNACKTEIQNVNKLLTIIKYGYYELLMDIAKWLIFGLAVAAFISILIPNDFFATYASNSWLSMLIALLISVPLYVCATASVPIAAVLMLKGLSPGAALIIFMAGPATNVATITVIKKVFGNKTLLTYLGSIIGSSFLFGAIINEFLPQEWFRIISQTITGHCASGCEEISNKTSWIANLSAFLLIGLIINGYIQNYLGLKNAKNKQVIKSKELIIRNTKESGANASTKFTSFKPLSPNSITLSVTGMTCSHCKNSVESNIRNLPNIQSVDAQPSKNSVTIIGKNIDIEMIKKIINDLGYNC